MNPIRWVRYRMRLVKLWSCRRRGHGIGNPLVVSHQGPAVLNPDGTITEGDVFEVRGTVCMVCDKGRV